MLLDLGHNTLLAELVLLKVARIGEPGCVEDANLRRSSRLLTMFTNSSTYHYSVLACKFVKVG